VPGCPLRRGDSKRAEFFAERIVHNVQQTAQKLSEAVHLHLEHALWKRHQTARAHQPRGARIHATRHTYVHSLSAAGFLYIGLADLIPGLHERQRPGIGPTQFLFIILGMATVLLVHGGHG